MSEEKRMLGNYEVTQSIYVGDKEVVLAVDKKEQYPFLVCYCDYHNPLSAAWATEGVASDDYLEAMEIFTERVQSQIDRTRAELSKFPFDKAVFTKEHCIPDDHKSNIVGKVVVLNAEPKRYEYQHPAYQLKLNGGDMKSVQGDSGHAQVKMVADVYSHIIDDDRRLNAQRFEEQFYQSKVAPEIAEAPKEATPTTSQEEQEMLLKLLANPEMATLLKSLAKNL